MFSGDALVLGEHDAATVLRVAVSDELFDFLDSDVGGGMVFVFDKDGGFVGSMDHDVAGFFGGADEFDAGGGEHVDEQVVGEIFGEAALSGTDFEASEDGGDVGDELLLIQGVGSDGGGEFVYFSVLFQESGVEVLLVGGDDGGDVLVGLREVLLDGGLHGGEVFFDFGVGGEFFVCFFDDGGCFFEDGVCVFAKKWGEVFLGGGEEDLFDLFGLFFLLVSERGLYLSFDGVEFGGKGMELFKDGGLDLFCSGVTRGKDRGDKVDQGEIHLDNVEVRVGFVKGEYLRVRQDDGSLHVRLVLSKRECGEVFKWFLVE